MELNEIFQSDKLVQPVWFSPESQSNDLYANAGRARQVAEDQYTWKVGGSSTPNYGWVVEYGKISPTNPDDHMFANQTQVNINNGNIISRTLNKIGKWWDEINLQQYNIFSKDKLNKAKEWMGYFKQIGLSDIQSIALIGNVVAECNFNHKAVNQQELRGQSSNPRTHGWTGAGEGLVQFTFWDNKLKLIEKYNADSRRQGDKITTDPEKYNQDNARHISSVNKHDAALFVEYWYKDLMNKYNDSDFDNLMGAFYLRKAGNHSQKIKKGNYSLIEQAYNTGVYYNNYHNKESYRQGKQKQTNNFVKALRFSYDLGKELGYFT